MMAFAITGIENAQQLYVCKEINGSVCVTVCVLLSLKPRKLVCQQMSNTLKAILIGDEMKSYTNNKI